MIENLNDCMIYTRNYLDANQDMRYTVLYGMSKNARARKDRFPREWNRRNRRSFDKEQRKYTVMDSCYQCQSPDDGISFVRHHIIPISKWGPNRRVNIITLCTRCHAYFHPWLKEKPQIFVKPEIPMWELDQPMTFSFKVSEDIVADIMLVAHKIKR